MESNSTLVQALKALIWPQRCIFCNELIFDNRKCTCEKCKENLPYIKGKICFKCGREKKECMCTSNIMYYDKAVCALYFTDNVRKCIHSMKFRFEKNISQPLSEYMLDALNEYYSDERFDLIVNVPMLTKERKRRGFNQSEELAFYISRKTNIPFKRDMIKKLYKTEKQFSVHSIERFGNVFAAYHIDPEVNLDGLNVLLIDDVQTTGATLSECGKMLLLAGAQSVCCLSFAATKKKEREGQKQ